LPPVAPGRQPPTASWAGKVGSIVQPVQPVAVQAGAGPAFSGVGSSGGGLAVGRPVATPAVPVMGNPDFRSQITPVGRERGAEDNGHRDTGRVETGRVDGIRVDTGRFDTGRIDAGRVDPVRPDAGRPVNSSMPVNSSLPATQVVVPPNGSADRQPRNDRVFDRPVDRGTERNNDRNNNDRNSNDRSWDRGMDRMNERVEPVRRALPMPQPANPGPQPGQVQGQAPQVHVQREQPRGGPDRDGGGGKDRRNDPRRVD